MSNKLKFKKVEKELEATGIFDETTSLDTNVKGKITHNTGDFIGNGISECNDILEGVNLPHTGNFGGYYNRYTQANMSVTSRKYGTKDGNLYAYVIKRAPDISSTSTWGGVSIFPPDLLQRVAGKKFRFSFDYRGYSNGNHMDVYQCNTIGWCGSGIVSSSQPFNSPIGGFDTDWEWRHYEQELTINQSLLDLVAGHYDWNSTTQYGTGWYGVRYNGYAYRHRSGWPAPTLGVDPETEYQAGGIYDWKISAEPGVIDAYNNIKIGFTYQTQYARGTHVHIDNITLTDITDNQTWKYDLSSEEWITEELVDSGIDVLIKGTAGPTQMRSDTGTTDIFAIEGNRYVEINGSIKYNGGGRGLMLTIFDDSGSVSSQVNYDVYGDANSRNNLATALAALTDTDYWCLSSFDAIGSVSAHDNAPNLRNQLISMGSRMWDPNQGDIYLWYYNTGDVRNPYACVGKGQNILKEDGSGASDTTYKRKGVIQTRIS